MDLLNSFSYTMKLVISSFPAMISNSDRQDKYYCLFCVWNTTLSLVVGKKRHLIATTRNNSVELKTWLCSQNTNQLILHCIYWWQRIEAQLVHRDDVKLQCLTRIKCFTLSLCEPVNVRPTQKEYCHLLVHLLMSH